MRNPESTKKRLTPSQPGEAIKDKSLAPGEIEIDGGSHQ
jgi:hypothetical protein